eukprot:14479552-Alexandrium_andersonii.AAC.1
MAVGEGHVGAKGGWEKAVFTASRAGVGDGMVGGWSKACWGWGWLEEGSLKAEWGWGWGWIGWRSEWGW